MIFLTILLNALCLLGLLGLLMVLPALWRDLMGGQR